MLISGITIGPADPALQGGAVSGVRKIARKYGTFFEKLNCSTSKSTRFRLEMYIFSDFYRHFHYFAGIWFLMKHLIKLPLGAPNGQRGRQQGGAHTQRYATEAHAIWTTQQGFFSDVLCTAYKN